jgi:hypothetical protein
LRAEWSELDAPKRIQALARRHLPLKPIEINQYDTLDHLPERPLDIVPPTSCRPEQPTRSVPSSRPRPTPRC